MSSTIVLQEKKKESSEIVQRTFDEKVKKKRKFKTDSRGWYNGESVQFV